MTKHGFWRMGIIDISSISGIELALWNILSKHLGVPVWQLLDGSVRESLSTSPISASAPPPSRGAATSCTGQSSGGLGAGTSRDGLGLGIEVDESVIDAHPFQPDILHARGAVIPDGTVVDW